MQATVTFRFINPELAASRIDFAIDSGSGRWRAAPLEQTANLLTELAQQHGLDLVATMSLTGAMTSGLAALRQRMLAGLQADDRLRDTGLAVFDVRVVAVRPEPDLERALQTPTREQVQQDADKAMYERRAVAVERERAISENELQSKIELRYARSGWSSSRAPTSGAVPPSRPQRPASQPTRRRSALGSRRKHSRTGPGWSERQRPRRRRPESPWSQTSTRGSCWRWSDGSSPGSCPTSELST